MSQQILNLGTTLGDGTGDTIHAAGVKINANFSELYANIVPAQSSFSGYVLTTNGTTLSWASPTTIANLSVPVASTTVSGTVKVDGTTVLINNGVISVPTVGITKATAYTVNGGTIGGVIPDGTSISINSSTGVISANAVSLVGNTLSTGITASSLTSFGASPTLITPNIGAATGSSLSVTGQLVSTVATGTPPLSVVSTTAVTNLNSSLLLGSTWASPGAIGSTTANSGAFTTLTTTTPLAPQYGGTGISNTSTSTLTLSGGYGITFGATATTSVTLPTSGTLLTVNGSGSSLTFGTGTLSLAGNLTHSGAFTTSIASTAATSVTLPTTGTLASLSVTQTWSAAQTFNLNTHLLKGSSTGVTTLNSGLTGLSNNTLTLPITATDTLAALGTAQTWTANQTFGITNLIVQGTSTGVTTIGSANASASNYTLSLPAATSTLAILGPQTFTGTQTFADSSSWSTSGISLASGKSVTTAAGALLLTSAATNSQVNIASGATQYLTVVGSTSSGVTVTASGGNLLLATAGGTQATITNTASPTNYLTLTGGTSPTVGTSAGNLSLSPTTIIGSGSTYSWQLSGGSSNVFASAGGTYMIFNPTTTTNAAIRFTAASTTSAEIDAMDPTGTSSYQNLTINAASTTLSVSGATAAKISTGGTNYLTFAGSATNPVIGTSSGTLSLNPSTGNVVISSGTNPSLSLYDSSQGADLKMWRHYLTGTNYQLLASNDALSSATIGYQVTRGTTYNIASHTWYTSTTAGTAVTGMSLTGSSTATSLSLGNTATVGSNVFNGTNSGTAGGASINVQNNSSAVIQIGNYSAIAGGAYSANATIWASTALNIYASNYSTNPAVQVNSAGSGSNALTFNGGTTGNPSIGTVSGNMTIGPVASITEAVVITGAAPTSTQAFYTNSGSVQYYTTNTANNWIINIAGGSSTTLTSILAVGQAITMTLMVTQGATAYYQTAIQIDSVTQVVNTNVFWQGGTAPGAGNANGIDVYSYTIIKTASTPTYTVLASLTRY